MAWLPSNKPNHINNILFITCYNLGVQIGILKYCELVVHISQHLMDTLMRLIDIFILIFHMIPHSHSIKLMLVHIIMGHMHILIMHDPSCGASQNPLYLFCNPLLAHLLPQVQITKTQTNMVQPTPLGNSQLYAQ